MAKKTQTQKKRQLSITIYSADEGVEWEGTGDSVSSENSQGPFDILPGHARFITIVQNKPVVIREDRKIIREETYPVSVIYVDTEKVEIYTEIE